MKITIQGEYIKIGQFLKKTKIINTGGEAKVFLENNIIKINGKKPEGRSTKVRPGDTIWVNDDLFQVISEK